MKQCSKCKLWLTVREVSIHASRGCHHPAMFRKVRLFGILGTFVIALVLAGCSGEPTAMDSWAIEKCGDKDAVRKQVEVVMEAMRLGRHYGSSIDPSWINPELAERDDFPKIYHYPVKARDKTALGQQVIAVIHTTYDYDCMFVDTELFPVGYE